MSRRSRSWRCAGQASSGHGSCSAFELAFRSRRLASAASSGATSWVEDAAVVANRLDDLGVDGDRVVPVLAQRGRDQMPSHALPPPAWMSANVAQRGHAVGDATRKWRRRVSARSGRAATVTGAAVRSERDVELRELSGGAR
jgi:hypothetical protein